MEITRAVHDDIGSIIEYMQDYHATSNLSDIPFDRKSVFKIAEHFVEHRDCAPLIAKSDGKVVGVLFGTLEPYFFNAKRVYGTDLFFLSKGAGPQLWKKFKEWAFASGADRLIQGVSSGDERADQLLEILGMQKTGGMYVLRQESS